MNTILVFLAALAALVTIFLGVSKLDSYFEAKGKILIKSIVLVLILTLVLILIGITFEIYKLDSYFEAEGKILAIAVIILVALSVISIFYIHKLYSYITLKENKQTPIPQTTSVNESSTKKNIAPKIFGAVQSDRLPIFINEPLNDISAAKIFARKNDKLIFIVIYDEKHHSKSQLLYSLGCFMEYFTTKKLVEEHFVSVLVSSSHPDAAALVPEDDPLENCLWVVLSTTGEIVLREGVYANSDEGLKRVRAVIDKCL